MWYFLHLWLQLFERCLRIKSHTYLFVIIVLFCCCLMIANMLKCLESLLLFLYFFNPDVDFTVMVLLFLLLLDRYIFMRTSLQGLKFLMFLYLLIQLFIFFHMRSDGFLSCSDNCIQRVYFSLHFLNDILTVSDLPVLSV